MATLPSLPDDILIQIVDVQSSQLASVCQAFNQFDRRHSGRLYLRSSDERFLIDRIANFTPAELSVIRLPYVNSTIWKTLGMCENLQLLQTRFIEASDGVTPLSLTELDVGRVGSGNEELMGLLPHLLTFRHRQLVCLKENFGPLLFAHTEARGRIQTLEVSLNPADSNQRYLDNFVAGFPSLTSLDLGLQSNTIETFIEMRRPEKLISLRLRVLGIPPSPMIARQLRERVLSPNYRDCLRAYVCRYHQTSAFLTSTALERVSDVPVEELGLDFLPSSSRAEVNLKNLRKLHLVSVSMEYHPSFLSGIRDQNPFLTDVAFEGSEANLEQLFQMFQTFPALQKLKLEAPFSGTGSGDYYFPQLQSLDVMITTRTSTKRDFLSWFPALRSLTLSNTRTTFTSEAMLGLFNTTAFPTALTELSLRTNADDLCILPMLSIVAQSGVSLKSLHLPVLPPLLTFASLSENLLQWGKLEVLQMGSVTIGGSEWSMCMRTLPLRSLNLQTATLVDEDSAMAIVQCTTLESLYVRTEQRLVEAIGTVIVRLSRCSLQHVSLYCVGLFDRIHPEAIQRQLQKMVPLVDVEAVIQEDVRQCIAKKTAIMPWLQRSEAEENKTCIML